MCVGGVGGGGSSFVGTGHVWRSPQNYLDVDGCVWLPHSMSVYVCLLFWVSCVIVWFFWVARLANKLVTLRDAAETYLVKQVTALSNAAKEANEAEKLAQDDYLAGLAGLVTVLESQRRVFDAKRSLIDLQNLRLQNRIDLYLALGGEFTQPESNSEKE